MRSPRLFASALLLYCLPFAMCFVKPESDGRSYFSVIMSSMLELYMKSHSKESAFIISPAAVQKTLAILYNSVDDNDVDLLDAMLIEMGLKYFDDLRLIKRALEELTSYDILKKDRYEKLDKPIKRADVLDYFKSDFIELGTDMSYSSTIITPKDLELSADFSKFAKEFFNASILHDNDQRIIELYRNNGINDAKIRVPTNCINIYNEIFYISRWKPTFVETNGHLTTRGQFRYGEIINPEDKHMSVRIVELPLEAQVPLSVIFIIPKKNGNDLTWSTSYDVIRPLTDPAKISKILKMHPIEVKISKTFVFRTQANLIEKLSKKGVTQANIYEAKQKFKRIFNIAPKEGIRLGGLWQNVELQVQANIVDKFPVHHVGFFDSIKAKIIDFTQTETFDMTEKPFLFILKSDAVIYFMGYSYCN